MTMPWVDGSLGGAVSRGGVSGRIAWGIHGVPADAGGEAADVVVRGVTSLVLEPVEAGGPHDLDDLSGGRDAVHGFRPPLILKSYLEYGAVSGYIIK